MTCNGCGFSLDASYFYKSNKSKCKLCVCLDVRENRRLKAEYYRDFDRCRNMLPHRVEARKEYAKTPAGKRVVRASKDKWKERNAYKRAAEITLGNAVRDGRVERQRCERCGKRAHGHHEDYMKPLDVVWLCPKHHKDRHAELLAAGVIL